MRNIAALFSLLMPGFGQIYNRQFIKGIIFVAVEHFDNMTGKINKAIQLDLNGFHHEALDTVIYDGLLFYPGFYVYVVWDAWYYAKRGANKTKTAAPFLAAGFLGEFGALFASRLSCPALTVGLAMVVPILISLVVFRKQ